MVAVSLKKKKNFFFFFFFFSFFFFFFIFFFFQAEDGIRDLVRSRGLGDVYKRQLRDEGELRGLIGPRELPRLWTRHIVNSAQVAEFLSLIHI